MTESYSVIVIDDDQEMRNSLTHLLGRVGWTVTGFADAEVALRRIETLQPDVVLSDVRMPGLSDVPFAVQMEPNLVIEFYAQN